MMLTCANCKTAFTLDDPAKVICSDDGIFFYCDKDCKDKFAYSAGLEDDFENWSEKLEENRQCPRSIVNWPVTIKTSHRTISGETRDVSPGGAFMYCDRPMTPKQFFFLSIHIHSSTAFLSCMAESVWSTHGGMGVRFDYENPEQGHLLAKFILDALNSDWKEAAAIH
jgi:hypothetical protein